MKWSNPTSALPPRSIRSLLNASAFFYSSLYRWRWAGEFYAEQSGSRIGRVRARCDENRGPSTDPSSGSRTTELSGRRGMREFGAGCCGLGRRSDGRSSILRNRTLQRCPESLQLIFGLTMFFGKLWPTPRDESDSRPVPGSRPNGELITIKLARGDPWNLRAEFTGHEHPASSSFPSEPCNIVKKIRKKKKPVSFQVNCIYFALLYSPRA